MLFAYLKRDRNNWKLNITHSTITNSLIDAIGEVRKAMYLVSIYFDEKTNKTIQSLIDKVAKSTGNYFMIEGNVPPHITVAAFETKREEEILCRLQTVTTNLVQGKLKWVSVGTFLPNVIFAAPVLNEYLQNMMQTIYSQMESVDETIMNPFYQPFGWMPHTTIGKLMIKEQMQEAFAVLQEQFVPFEGTVVKIGLAKTNPYTELALFELKEQ